MSTTTGIQIRPRDAAELIAEIIRSGSVPMLQGAPGIGKTAIFAAVAKLHNLKLIDVRLSMSDPSDLNGFPKITDRTIVIHKGTPNEREVVISKGGYVPMDTFPVDTDELPIRPDGKPYDGWLINFDELPGAPKTIQLAAYKILNERMVGNFKLHPNVAVCAAGNRLSDKAGSVGVTTAMKSRMVWLELESNLEDWMVWAVNEGIDFRVRKFVEFEVSCFNNFDPDSNAVTYACERTWHKLSNLIKTMPKIKPLFNPVIHGTVGSMAASKFIQFCKLGDDLPTIDEILSNPTKAIKPEDRSTQFFVTGLLENNMNVANAPALVKYLERLPKEFQMLTLRKTLSGKPTLMSVDAINNWAVTNADDLTPTNT